MANDISSNVRHAVNQTSEVSKDFGSFARRSIQLQKQIARLDQSSGTDEHVANTSGAVGVHRRFHLHRFECYQLLSRSYSLARDNGNADDEARHGSAHV